MNAIQDYAQFPTLREKAIKARKIKLITQDIIYLVFVFSFLIYAINALISNTPLTVEKVQATNTK